MGLAWIQVILIAIIALAGIISALVCWILDKPIYYRKSNGRIENIKAKKAKKDAEKQAAEKSNSEKPAS